GAGGGVADGGAGAALNIDAVPIIGGSGAGRVQADAVAQDYGIARRADNLDAVEGVAGDHVAGAGEGAADQRVGGRVLDEDALGVRPQPGAAEPEPDDVAHDLRADGVALDLDSIGGDDLVAGDHVAGPGGGAADDGVGGAGLDNHTGRAVADGADA